MTIVNALSVDVEDYFHVQAFADRVRRDEWGGIAPRVIDNTQRLLDLFAEFEVRATFFVLGWLADRFPQLVQRIAGAGHDLGCHSYWHRLVYEMTPDDFRDDLRRATAAIEDASGRRVDVYRAPSFSITARSLWALDILVEEGYRADSSIYPIRHDLYGMPSAERFVHCIETASGPVHEFPPSVRRLGNRNLPVGGGGWLRLYPGWLTCRWLARINHRDRCPFMVYVHPWEVDPGQPRLPGRLRSRFRHYQNLHSTTRKLRRLLERFRFAPMGEVLDHFADASLAGVNHPAVDGLPCATGGSQVAMAAASSAITVDR